MKGWPVKKPTGWLSNSQEILKELQQRCTGRNGLCSAKPGQNHAPCSGQMAKGAATYPRELCKAILRGMRRQLKALNMIQEDCYGLQHSGFEELEMIGSALGSSEMISLDSCSKMIWCLQRDSGSLSTSSKSPCGKRSPEARPELWGASP